MAIMKIKITSGIQIKTHLKSLRNSKGWTQQMLADKMGLSQSRIVQIESNPELVSIDQLIHLFNILGVSMSLEVPSTDNLSPLQTLPPTPKSKKLRGQKVNTSINESKVAASLSSNKSNVKW
ncbi:MAG: helix-turn-helix transcriptional regulator [Methylotenera sp.]|nr:helix-turn-helix transcriptional regulator [Methylotenera sp.]MDO9232177.1 helix-turn-helix transcriptional regulator [Methylotenera sp.]MDO9388668.1 helix-turn-helix transcriptional regulator [Methylotenera sp.]MDP2280305.1 helix-turn-helix transcriptional regulator [Methylotenera sp.]MDP2403782.1 helix-turn-helix transcriptional regulator [Methylotenera sp.]